VTPTNEKNYGVEEIPVVDVEVHPLGRSHPRI
jgi:hypothetical protein